MKSIQEQEKLWRNARPVIQNSVEDLFAYLRTETDEAEAEIDNPQKLAAELADILLFTCAIANQYGINLEEATMRKLERNHLKYPASELQEGDYQEKRLELRKWWNENVSE